MFGRWSHPVRIHQARARKQFEEEGLHEELEERFRKTLYYGELPDDDCPSLPLSNLAVKFFQDATPRGLGQVDLSQASSLADDAYVSPGSLITSMIYAKRLRNRNSEYLQKMSSSDLFFISVMMASKYMYDEGVDEEVFNDEWAEAANLEVDEVNQMEMEFLSAMDWQLFVSQSEFLGTVKAVERSLAWSQGCSRGWLSYTDVSVLWHNKLLIKLWTDLVKEWTKVLAVGSAAYVAGVLTMVGSTALAVQLSTSMAGYMLVTQPSMHLPGAPVPSLQGPVVSDSTLYNDQGTAQRSRIEVNASDSIPSPETEPSMETVSTTQGLLERVLPQLWAVTTFKDRFVHLLCALSRNCKQTRRERKFPTRCQRGNAVPEEKKSSDPPMYANERLLPSRLSGRCEACPLRVKGKRSGNQPEELDPGYDNAKDLPSMKWNLRVSHWSRSRPPDEAKLDLDLLQTQDFVRGFTTSVPVAA